VLVLSLNTFIALEKVLGLVGIAFGAAYLR
jgi:hypothetical protein